MKANITVEYAGNQYTENDVVQKIKDAWLSSGKKIREMKSLDIYIKPEEAAAYYVINDGESGRVAL